MTNAVNLKSQYRRPKQARSQRTFNQLLDAAEAHLQNGNVNDFALNDLADSNGITVGSVYHFFPSKEALLLALADRALGKFAEMTEAIDVDGVSCWQDIWRRASTTARAQYIANKPAMMLIFGPACSWQIRLADAAGNNEIAAALASSMRRAFDFSFADNLEELCLRGIVISDAFWRTSFEEHGTITEDYAEISFDASVAYLSRFIPEKLPLRPQEDDQAQNAREAS